MLLCSRRPGDNAHIHTDPACSAIVGMHHNHTSDTWTNKMISSNGHSHRHYLTVAKSGISQVRAHLRSSNPEYKQPTRCRIIHCFANNRHPAIYINHPIDRTMQWYSMSNEAVAGMITST